MKLPFSGLWGEFKAFAFQGNMIELAVAVVIGGAFGTVIHSLVDDVIMPTVGYAINTATSAAVEAKHAAVNAASHVGFVATQPTTVPATQSTGTIAANTPPAAPVVTAPPAAPPAAPAEAKPTEPVKIDLMVGPVPIGKFIGALINFLIVALAVFLMIVKLLGGVMKKFKTPEVPGEPTTRECPECLSIIPIKARRCSHCTAVIVPPTAPAL